jgi:hypothetical protein
MKHLILNSVFASFFLFSMAPWLSAQIQLPAKLQKQVKSNRLPATISIPTNITIKTAIDLVAQDIVFSIVSRKDKKSGSVKIEDIVKNTGSSAYNSAPEQQIALLYEEVPGTAPRLVASQNFQNVPAGGTVKVSFTRNWNRSATDLSEFPPNYILVIVFEPDIYIDGNDQNNDSNTTNNRLSKSGAAINSLSW